MHGMTKSELIDFIDTQTHRVLSLERALKRCAVADKTPGKHLARGTNWNKDTPRGIALRALKADAEDLAKWRGEATRL